MAARRSVNHIAWRPQPIRSAGRSLRLTRVTSAPDDAGPGEPLPGARRGGLGVS